MRLHCSMIVLLALSMTTVACEKKKKKGSVAASLMKSETVSASLAFGNDSAALTSVEGSNVESFTPTSLKIPIFRVSVCSGNSDCVSLYTCGVNTIEGCAVELSDIDAFVDALNASPAEIEEGKSYDHISVQFCPDGDSSGIQHLTVNGTVTIQGTSYATDPTAGLVAGTEGTDTSINVHGGCASYYPITPGFTVSKNETTQVKLFFDASLYVYGGVDDSDSYVSDGSCAGSSSAYVCAPVVTVVPTIDSGNPTAEHYLVANIDPATGGSEDSAPTASVVLYFSSAGAPIGGVQNAYRLSGPTVSWGLKLDGGLGLYPKAVDDNTVSFGEPEGSISLANWFKEFKRATHTGTYVYSMNGVESEGIYQATKL